MSLFRWLKRLFSGRKTGYSIKGFWGQTKHYNRDGVQIGYTVKWFWGVRRRYDMNGNLVSYSVKNFWGGRNTYDAQGNLISRSRKNIFGGYNIYDKKGKKIGESYKNIWDGYTHYDVDEPTSDSSYTYEYEPASPRSVSVSVAPIQKKTEPKKQEQEKQPKSTYRDSAKERTKSTDSARNYSESKTQEELVIPQNSEESRKAYEKYVAFNGQDIDRTVEYYGSIAEYLVENESIGQNAKVLAFGYQGLKEFPAIAYVVGETVKVVPLIRHANAFEFPVSELAEAQTVEVADLDMSAIDNEFVTFGISGLAKEFEELYPDYQFGGDGMCRTQCELPCGLVVTEMSLNKMRELL